MSGHSKWASIKHQKGAKDKARGKTFAKLIRQIEVAAREGGGDMTANATLRTMFAKARSSSVPLDTIQRAIRRGIGEEEGVQYVAINYEGYAPCGVAMYIETLTDNRNRTGPEIRSIFTKHGGSMAEPGAVAWQFERKGQLLVSKKVNGDELMLAAAEAGAQDVSDGGEQWVVITEAHDVMAVKEALDAAGMAVESFEMPMIASQTVPLETEDDARKVLKLMDMFEDNDDVQNVYANFDISDEIFEIVGA